MADEAANRRSGAAIPRALEPVGGDAKMIRVESDMGSQLVALHVWSVGASAWVKMTQPIIDAGDLYVTMGDVEKLLAKAYWKDVRFEFSSGSLLYKGLHTTHEAATDDANWHIFKYTWDGDGNPERIEGPLVGTWDGRPGLAWGT